MKDEIGANPKNWGPKLWDTLFISVMGRYPNRIDINNEEHAMIKEYFKRFITDLQVILPCIYCRKSFAFFLKQMPLDDDALSGKKQLMYWLYSLKDLVNKKLLKQENDEYIKVKNDLKQLYKNGVYSTDDYIEKLQINENSFKTTPSPSFSSIFEKYQNLL